MRVALAEHASFYALLPPVSGRTSSSSSGKLIFHIFGALAEFERNLIRERTMAGLQAARARGRKGGRPKALDASQRALATRLYREKKHTIREICQLMGISKPTLYSYVEAEATDSISEPSAAEKP